MWKITAPLRVKVSKNKYFSLNLNIYRNAHFHVLNNAKIAFSKVVEPQLELVPPLNHATLKYVIYVPTKRRTDISNVCSIVDKFFSDAMVDVGVLPDDSYDYLTKVVYEYGGMDKEYPRVEIFITNVETQPMRIMLTSEDLQVAVKSFLDAKITINDDQEVLVTFLDDGTVAVDIEDAIDTKSTPKTKKVAPKPKAKSKVEEIPEEEEEDEAEAEEEQTTVKKSLFGGLNKPKN